MWQRKGPGTEGGRQRSPPGFPSRSRGPRGHTFISHSRPGDCAPSPCSVFLGNVFSKSYHSDSLFLKRILFFDQGPSTYSLQKPSHRKSKEENLDHALAKHPEEPEFTIWSIKMTKTTASFTEHLQSILHSVSRFIHCSLNLPTTLSDRYHHCPDLQMETWKLREVKQSAQIHICGQHESQDSNLGLWVSEAWPPGLGAPPSPGQSSFPTHRRRAVPTRAHTLSPCACGSVLTTLLQTFSPSPFVFPLSSRRKVFFVS